MSEKNNSNNEEKKKSAIGDQVKGATKKGIKAGAKKLLAMIAPALVPILIVVIVGLVFYSVVSLIGDFFEGIWEGIQNGISDFFNFDTGEIKVPDDKVDEIVKQLKEQYNIGPEDLGLLGDIDYTTATEDQIKEAERKYIKMFIEAQLVTQEINRGGFGLQGRVFVKTPIGDDTTNQKKLTYLAKDNMQNMANSGNINIQNYFSLDETGHILLPSIQITKETGKPETRTIILNSIDYKSMISQYSTPWNLLVYMELVAQNPKFMEKFVDLIKQSEINLSILYNTSYSKETRVHTYTNNVKVTDYKTVTNSTTHLQEQVEDGYHYEARDITETIIVEYTSVQPQVVVNFADTWIFKREATYKKNTTTDTNSFTDGPYNETAGGDSYKTNEQTVTTIENKNENYAIEGTPIEEYNGGTKGESGTFVWLLDQRYKIPNSSQKRSAGPDLVSGREIFFDRLKQTANTQGWEPIMRYVLYVYWGQSFGVTDFDANWFSQTDFQNVGSNELLIEYIHYWENASGPPMNADGTKYIIEDDGMGHPTVGYGVDIFNGGFAPLFIAAGYPTEIGGEVDKDFVDGLEKQEIKDNKEKITAIVGGLNLKEHQINALVSRAYNCGTAGAVSVKRGSPSLNFAESYNRYWKETDDLFEEKNKNANFNHELYTQYMSKPVTSEGKYLSGLERRRKSEWTLFQTGYYNVLNKWHSQGGKILENCVIVMNELLQNNVHYSLKNLRWNNIEESIQFDKYGCCCATYVTAVIYKTGVLTTDFINKYNYNFTGTINEGGVSTMLRDAGWSKINEEDAQAGDVCVYDGHTFIYAGENEIWDQTSGCISSSGESPTRGTVSNWNFYKSKYNLDIWRMP